MSRLPSDPLILDIEQLLHDNPGRLRHRVVCTVDCAVPKAGTAPLALPVHLIELGSPAADAPVLGLFGGVHGLERIGVEVVLTFLRSLLQRADWDLGTAALLERVRIVVMPLVNPGGLLRGTRANPSGIDLMRNAPVECLDGAPALVGGHRLSATLPWYRGAADQPMQPEAAALCTVVEERLLGQSFALALDCHSGFGQRDRIWFPHAHTARPIEHLPELLALSQLMEGALPHHPYLIEPQSRQYLAHGDLWDHLYLQARRRGDAVFLPLTLEMGSWLWIKKNPSQALTRIGLFNPHIAHRRERVLRRHLHLLDFLLRATAAQARWRPPAAERAAGHRQALSRWYPRVPEAPGTAP